MNGRGGKDRRAQLFPRGLSEICPLSSVIIPFGNARQRMLNHKSLILRHATLCNATQHTRIRIVNPPVAPAGNASTRAGSLRIAPVDCQSAAD